MSTRFFADPQVHLHWIRETPSRGLELPVSQTLDSLAPLPPCVQKAVRATGLQTVELHLPPFRPALIGSPEEWFDSLRFRQDAAGRLIAVSAADPGPLATMAFHQAMVLTLRAVSGDATPLTIVAEPARSPLLRQPLAARHVCARGLANAPAERSHHYARAYKALSLALQSALRECLPPAHIESVGELADRPHVRSLFAWSAAAPVTGRNVDQLGVDVLNSQLLQRAHAGITRRLAPRLAEAWEILARHGAPSLIRDSYRPAKAVKIAAHCRRHSQYVNLLFANEMRLISAFVQFCARIDGWRARAAVNQPIGPLAARLRQIRVTGNRPAEPRPAGNPAAVYREVRAAWEELEVHIRRFYQRHPHPALGSRLLLEAARSLEAIDYGN